MDYTIEYLSPLGPIILASDGDAITGLWFVGQKHFLAGIRTPLQQGDSVPVLRHAVQWLDDYWSGKQPSPASLPLEPRGTDFQRKVWQQLLQIPYGHTVTYGELARAYAAIEGLSAMSAQAIGSAVGRNPISVIIPCHRVIGTSGSMKGYAGGIFRKAFLLSHEQSVFHRI